MPAARLTLGLDAGLFSIPEGRIGVWNPPPDMSLSDLPKHQVDIIQGFRPDHDIWEARGYSVRPNTDTRYDLCVVRIPRAKDHALAMIAEAAERSAGAIVVDGQKTDGVDSIVKKIRGRADISEVLSKAHGKLFVIEGHNGFADWFAAPEPGPDGFITAPGVFSADRVDKGSALLAQALPGVMGPRVADLGAGWGYLSARALRCASVNSLHLIEASYSALECARLNVPDPRARFHWADVAQTELPDPIDTIISNPPFHASRAADPAIGQAFIAAAARLIAPQGVFYMVANRHLPYEKTLAEYFDEVTEFGGNAGFKLLRATRVKSKSRRGR